MRFKYKAAYDRNALANFAMILFHIAFTHLGIVFYNMIPESEFIDFNIKFAGTAL